MKNYYPDLPTLPYKRTSVSMPDVVTALRAMDLPVEIKRVAYMVFRIEGANGLSGVNNNYGGVQADAGTWGKEYEHFFTGVVEKAENGTGKPRLFLAFRDLNGFLSFLSQKLQARGVYVGGTTHLKTNILINGPETLALAYEREWVKGDAKAPLPPEKRNTVISIYTQATTLFK